MKNDLLKAFGPCATDGIDLSGWDTSHVSPETMKLIAEVLFDGYCANFLITQ